MIRRFFSMIIAVAAMLMMATGCHYDELYIPNDVQQIPDGYVKISFEASAPAMDVVDVRSADPDGVDIHNLTLFCFNEYGLFISLERAQINADKTKPSESGTYEAIIPEQTNIIHFVANQNPDLLTNEMFSNKTEDQVQSDMVGASGMLVYWSRFVRDINNSSIEDQLRALNGGRGIKLIRNQARISIVNRQSEHLIVTGFVTTNIHAFGTVAPFHPTKGFPTSGTSFEWPGDEPFVTLPENKVMMSDITDINTKSEDYIFEHENALENPVSVIIKGHLPNQSAADDLYYRVMIIDQNGEQIMIRRNHHYKLNISGKLSYGQKTFDEALTAPATNNVWVAVDDWVNEITDGIYSLAVDKTAIVLSEDKAGSALDVTYTITSKSSPLTDDDIAEVEWLDGNTVAAHSFSHSFRIAADGKSATGTITVQLHAMGDDESHYGKLKIKHGRLQRHTEIYMIKTQKFTPSWIGTQIYGGRTKEFVTFKFTIPETCPDVLYPFPVLISVNSLDPRSSAGVKLPVLRKGEEGYFGEDNDWGYKYVYTVEGPGPHRVYMHNILAHEDNATDKLTIEAEFFESLTKQFTYTLHNQAITVSGLSEFKDPNTPAHEEVIYYRLIPKKINAPVAFDMVMVDNDDNSAINAGEDDEFMLYSKTLDNFEDGEESLAGLPAGSTFDCEFFSVDPAYWQSSTNGRVMMFMPRNPNKSGEQTGQYNIYMKTNRPVSDDLVRISSNQSGQLSAHPDKAGQEYTGKSYRPCIFELATYRPFRFAAQIAVDGSAPQGTWSEGEVEDPVDNLKWSYKPSQQVDIHLEITSFQGTDDRSADPFGTEFRIFIDAPMLQIDQERLLSMGLAGKLTADPTKAGRFIYTVDKDREKEREYGNGQSVKYIDGTTGGVNQAGERKTLPFRTNTITSAGEIRISSDKDVVVFYDKVFKVTNQNIEGNIKYYDGLNTYDVAANEFVSFFVKKTGVRIGSVNITSDGRFSLNLRKEYDFDWENDEIEFDYIKEDLANGTATVYDLTVESLAELFRMTENNETIILTEIQSD